VQAQDVYFLPAPFSTNELRSNNINEGGNNQKDMLFNLGNAINYITIKILNLISYYH
jgi:hypothetical protein